jgi:hypothetical protein
MDLALWLVIARLFCMVGVRVRVSDGRVLISWHLHCIAYLLEMPPLLHLCRRLACLIPPDTNTQGALPILPLYSKPRCFAAWLIWSSLKVAMK